MAELVLFYKVKRPSATWVSVWEYVWVGVHVCLMNSDSAESLLCDQTFICWDGLQSSNSTLLSIFRVQCLPLSLEITCYVTTAPLPCVSLSLKLSYLLSLLFFLSDLYIIFHLFVNDYVVSIHLVLNTRVAVALNVWGFRCHSLPDIVQKLSVWCWKLVFVQILFHFNLLF